MGHPATDEQKNARRLFNEGGTLVIEAGAGTGKTSTLAFLALSTPRSGQYVAFNNAIVNDSKRKMPATVRCHTAHGLAMRDVGRLYRPRLDAYQRMLSWQLADLLAVDAVQVTTWTGERKRLAASFLAGLAMKGVARFCQSADPAPTWEHVPAVKNLDPPAVPGERSGRGPVNREVARHLEPALRRAWADLLKLEGSLPYEHGHYLKAWQLAACLGPDALPIQGLRRPKVYADYLLFDEAQDASPVMQAVVLEQDHCQLVFVGDSQQEIYSWAGAVNALAQVDADNVAYLSRSFRFGPAIAEVANLILGRLASPLKLTGHDPISSRVGPLDDPRAILCRTNAAAVREVLAAIDRGRRPFMVGGSGEVLSFVRAAQRLIGGEPVEHPELACFRTWGEVVEYVDEDEQGDDLALMVDLIEEFGCERILDALDNTVPEARSDVVVSTAHKAKGREWDTVRLADDFPENPGTEELRLLYVASTRARLVLDPTRVGWLAEDLGLAARVS